MRSIKNHLSLILALISILFAMQTYIVTKRSIDAYKQNLSSNYAIVVVSNRTLDINKLKQTDKIIKDIQQINVDKSIKKIDSTLDEKNIEFLKLTLPKFYKVILKKYPLPSEIEKLKKKLFENKSVTKIEDFKSSYEQTYKLLLLFYDVVSVFSFLIVVITVLLILKELRIWQFSHKERMNIMGLFGAPRWLSSAVLFRLAIVDAVLSSLLVYFSFLYIQGADFIKEQFESIGISVTLVSGFEDFGVMLGVALSISLALAVLIVITHKEEV